MKKSLFLIVLIAFFTSNNTLCQHIDSTIIENQSSVFFDSIYGINPTIINGIGNSINYYKANGHPYLYSKEYEKGTVTIKNSKFLNCSLNYDIYHQKIYLIYTNQFGSSNTIELSNAWIDGFSLGLNNFKILSFNDYKTNIFQVLGDDNIQILFLWSKEYKLNNMQTSYPYFFTDPKRISFVKIYDRTFKFHNNRSFVKAFDPKFQGSIKSYMRQHRISLSTDTNEKLLGLINYCNNISTK